MKRLRWVTFSMLMLTLMPLRLSADSDTMNQSISYRWIPLSLNPTSGYRIEKGKVFPGGEIDPEPVQGADPVTFEVAVTEKSNKFTFWGRDKNQLYFAGITLKQADRNTFVVISNQIAKDKDHVYCWDFHAGGFNSEVNVLADPVTFKRLTPPGDSADSQFWYFRDKRHIFDKWCKLVKDADPDTFRMIESPSVINDAIDSGHKYSLGRTVK